MFLNFFELFFPIFRFDIRFLASRSGIVSPDDPEHVRLPDHRDDDIRPVEVNCVRHIHFNKMVLFTNKLKLLLHAKRTSFIDIDY